MPSKSTTVVARPVVFCAFMKYAGSVLPLHTRVAFDHMKLPGNWSIQLPCDILASALRTFAQAYSGAFAPGPFREPTRGQAVKGSLQAIRCVSGSSPASGLRP